MENLIGLTGGMKERIAADNKLSVGAVNNAITVLVRKYLLVRSSQATYRINPRYFWKASQIERKRWLKHVLTVECKEA